MGWYDVFNYTTDTDTNDGADRQFRQIIAADTSSYSGTKIRVTIYASSDSTALDITGTSIGVSTADDDFDATPTRITWDTGSSTTTIAQNSSKVSDEITFSFDKTKRHLLHFNTDYRNFKYFNVANGAYYGAYTDPDYTMATTVGWPASSQMPFTRLEVYIEEGEGIISHSFTGKIV